MRRSTAAGLVYLWLVSLPLVAYARVQTWTSEEALWSAAAWWAPEKLRPWVQLGDYERAIRIWATGTRPGLERVGCRIAVENLSRVLVVQGRFQESEQWSSYRCDGPLSW